MDDLFKLQSWCLFYLEGVLGMTICLLGVVINVYAVGTLFKQRLKAIFHKLMLSLVIYDLIFVTFTIIVFSLSNLSKAYECELAFPISLIFFGHFQFFLGRQ